MQQRFGAWLAARIVGVVRTWSGATTGFLLAQAAIGYEWFASGLTKIVHGDFPGGLAHDLHDRQQQAAPWYRHFLKSAVIPHAVLFGYLIEIVELATGIVLIAGAATLLLRQQLTPTAHQLLAALTALAALAGLVLAVNFVLANGVGFRPVANDSFDEGIGLDALLVALQAILLGVSLVALSRGGRRLLGGSDEPSGHTRESV